MIYIVHHLDACDSLNTRTTTYHSSLGAAQAQYSTLVANTDDFGKVELVALNPVTLTEQIQQEAVLNG
jgi:hypothetical protein